MGILMSSEHGNSTAGKGFMPMLAIAAREARQSDEVKAKYAEKLLHVTKVTGNGLDGCLNKS